MTNTPSRNTRWMLSLSAVAAGVVAIVALFAPHELLRYAGFAVSDTLAVIVQLWSGALGALALMNWMSRGNLIGGIYNRPLLVANLFHAVVGASSLGRLAADAGGIGVTAGAVVYSIFAVWFGTTMFRSPVSSARQAEEA